MPQPPKFRANPLTPQFLWNEKAAQYVETESKRFVSRQVIRNELDNIVDSSEQRMRNITKRLASGNISLGEWQTRMMQQIKTTHLASAAMQRGGWQQMTQADYGRVGAIVKNQYEFLRNFAEQIAAGTQKLDGSLVSRAGLYGQAGRPTYYKFWGLEMGRRGFDEERSILNPAEHCDLCVSQAAIGFQPIGQMIPIGNRTCLAHDKCDVEYRNSKTGETLRV